MVGVMMRVEDVTEAALCSREVGKNGTRLGAVDKGCVAVLCFENLGVVVLPNGNLNNTEGHNRAREVSCDLAVGSGDSCP
jgi:hypothetical protein